MFTLCPVYKSECNFKGISDLPIKLSRENMILIKFVHKFGN